MRSLPTIVRYGSPRALPGIVLIGLFSGCGPAAVPTVEVSGLINFEDRPVQRGTVSFVPADGGGAPALLPIVDGRYAGRVTGGRKRIEIRGLRPATKPQPSTGGPGADEAEAVESFIPSQFNDQSGLSREVTPPGPLAIDFDLEN